MPIQPDMIPSQIPGLIPNAWSDITPTAGQIPRLPSSQPNRRSKCCVTQEWEWSITQLQTGGPATAGGEGAIHHLRRRCHCHTCCQLFCRRLLLLPAAAAACCCCRPLPPAAVGIYRRPAVCTTPGGPALSRPCTPAVIVVAATDSCRCCICCMVPCRRHWQSTALAIQKPATRDRPCAGSYTIACRLIAQAF